MDYKSIRLRAELFEGTYPMSQPFGTNPSWYEAFGLLGHNGWDYTTPVGTVLISCIDGTVTEMAHDVKGYGFYIKIENDQCGVIYAHLQYLPTFKIGNKIKAGDAIGTSGNTGNSTGPHLHFGIFPKPRDRSNGYAGYIDPSLITWVSIKEWDGGIVNPPDADKELAEKAGYYEKIRKLLGQKDKFSLVEEDIKKLLKEAGEHEEVLKRAKSIAEALETMNNNLRTENTTLLNSNKQLNGTIGAQEVIIGKRDKEITSLNKKLESLQKEKLNFATALEFVVNHIKEVLIKWVQESKY